MPHLFAADRIYTLDHPNEFYKAMIVNDGKIQNLLGENEFEQEKANPVYEKIHEFSGYIFPGFIDSHIHAISYGKYLDYVDLRSVQSIEELIHKISLKAKNTPEGEWIYGFGWNQVKFTEQRLPNKQDLDRISMNHPIILKRVCTHILVANSVVLGKADINEQTPEPPGGIIDRDKLGRPTGILRETAIDLLDPIIPQSIEHDIIRWLQTAQSQLNSFGITSIHTLDEYCYPVYRSLKDQLTVRVYFCPKYKNLSKIYEMEESAKTGVGDDFLRLGRVKLFADGSLGAQTAALKEPYENTENYGIPTHSLDELMGLIKNADEMGWQIETHAIGDKAAELTLNCYEKIYHSNYRPVLTHCQILAADLIQRMADLEVIASIQPIFIEQDMDFVEDFVGKKRMGYAYAWKSLLDGRVHCSGGSDCPVDSPNPLFGIHCAVTRMKLEGIPSHGWIPAQKITVWDAFRLFTIDAAYAEYQEHQKGLLKLNYLADFVLLDKNPFQIPEDEIQSIRVLKTFLAGKEVYSRE